jgi:mRNA interferase MazF
VIHQGEIYWVDLGEPTGAGPGFRHPHLVVQNDLFNRSRIDTVVVCALTSNLRRAEAPGNVLLETGEADLPKASVVNVSQLYTVGKDELVERIGALAPSRLRAVLDGIELLLEPRDLPALRSSAAGR